MSNPNIWQYASLGGRTKAANKKHLCTSGCKCKNCGIRQYKHRDYCLDLATNKPAKTTFECTFAISRLTSTIPPNTIPIREFARNYSMIKDGLKLYYEGQVYEITLCND